MDFQSHAISSTRFHELSLTNENNIYQRLSYQLNAVTEKY